MQWTYENCLNLIFMAIIGLGNQGGKGPAILTMVSIPDVRGKYIVSLGEKGMLWEGKMLALFANPEAALKELRKRLGGK